MTTAIIPLREMRDEIARFTPRMVEVVGARGADEYVQRQIGLTMLTIKDNAALQRCSVESIATALIRICGWRLEVGRTAYLLPFKGSCTASPSWQGLVELMLRARHVRDCYAEVVYERDHFRLVQGMEKRLEHEPALIADRGEIVGAYAVATLQYGRATFEWLTAAQIEAIRARAPQPNSPLWTQHREEAYKKTAMRRLAKRMPQGTAALDSALAADEIIGTSADLADAALDMPSASMLRGAGPAPMYLPHERSARPVGDRAQHAMQALGAGGDAYGASVPTGARVEVPARVVTNAPPPRGDVEPFAGMPDYDPRDLYPERYDPTTRELLPEYADAGDATDAAPALALDDQPATRARRSPQSEGH